jgi:hypothetical protein
VAVIALIVACRASAAREPSPPPAPSVVHGPQSVLTASEVEALLCERDATCKLLGIVSASAGDLGGRRVAVVETKCPHEGQPDARADATWLLEGGPGSLRRGQMLGYHCLPHGTPVITVRGPSRLRQVETETVAEDGGASSWTISDLALDPPRLLRDTYVQARGQELLEQTWDFEASSGGTCVRRSQEAPCTTVALDFPWFSVADPTFASGAWRWVSLGDCGVNVDGVGNGVLEPAGAASRTIVRALLADDAIYIEVSDDAFVTTGKVVDRLDVILTTKHALPGEPLSWRLFMDGSVEAVSGPPPSAEMVSVTPTVRRFKLTGVAIAWRVLALLSYIDTADGLSERVRLLSGTEEGEIREVPKEKATCVIEGGSLHVRRLPIAVAPFDPLTR